MKMDKVLSDDLPKKDEFDYNKALTWFFGNFFYEGNSDIPGAIVSALDKQIPHLPYRRWQDGSNELACTRCDGNVSKENGKYCTISSMVALSSCSNLSTLYPAFLYERSNVARRVLL